MNVQSGIQVDIGFGLPEITIPDLRQIRADVVGIVESFAPDFS